MITIKLKIYAYADGKAKYWYQNDKRHRDNDQPAVIYADGEKCWFQNDKRHRNNDQPAVILANGIKQWYQNGKFIKEESK